MLLRRSPASDLDSMAWLYHWETSWITEVLGLQFCQQQWNRQYHLYEFVWTLKRRNRKFRKLELPKSITQWTDRNFAFLCWSHKSFISMVICWDKIKVWCHEDMLLCVAFPVSIGFQSFWLFSFSANLRCSLLFQLSICSGVDLRSRFLQDFSILGRQKAARARGERFAILKEMQ